MKMDCVLSPEELYFLAQYCKGKTINYDYIAMMDDISNKVLFQQSCRNSLYLKGILEEDFMGNLELNQQIKELLDPVFFEDFESGIEVIRRDNKRRMIRIHFMKERGTIVEDADRMLMLHPVKPDSIQLLAEELFPERNNRNSLPQPKAYHSADYDAVIWIRNFHQNGNAVVNLYFLSQGFFWELASETELRPIPANQFMETLLRTLKGE